VNTPSKSFIRDVTRPGPYISVTIWSPEHLDSHFPSTLSFALRCSRASFIDEGECPHDNTIREIARRSGGIIGNDTGRLQLVG
jgi:hypothetical protein